MCPSLLSTTLYTAQLPLKAACMATRRTFSVGCLLGEREVTFNCIPTCGQCITQEDLNELAPAERASGTGKKGLLATLKGFVLGDER